MKIRSVLLLILLFIMLIPIIIIVYSYIPANMIKLATETKWEYFYENISYHLLPKAFVAILISGVITGGICFLICRSRKIAVMK